METIIDNTTVFGAGQALKTHLENEDDWSLSANRFHLKCLSDMIENLILYELIFVDGVSRSFLSEGGKVGFRAGWREVFDLETNDEDLDIVNDISFWHAMGPNLVIEAARRAFADFLLSLDDGSFQRNISELQINAKGILPQFYQSGKRFKRLFKKSLPLIKKKEAKKFHDDRIDILVNPEILHVPFSGMHTRWWPSEHLLSTSDDGDWNFDFGIYDDIDSASAKLDQIIKKSEVLANYAIFAFRGFYYFHLANMLSASYRPHSWRSLQVDNLIDRRKFNFTDFTARKIGKIRNDLADSLNKEFLGKAFDIDFPPLSSFVLRQCESRGQIVTCALQVRESEEAKKLRSWMAETQQAIDKQDDLIKVDRAFKELALITADLSKKFGVGEDKDEPFKVRIAVPFVSFEIPLLKSRPKPDWVKQLGSRRTHFAWLKRITEQSLKAPPIATTMQGLK